MRNDNELERFLDFTVAHARDCLGVIQANIVHTEKKLTGTDPAKVERAVQRLFKMRKKARFLTDGIAWCEEVKAKTCR